MRACRSAWRRLMRRCCSKRARAKRRSIPLDAVPAGPQADRRRPPAISMRPTAAATWSPSSARCASPGSVRSRSRASPRPTRRSRLITTPTRRPTRAKETRNLSQAVVPDQATANAIAAQGQGRRDARRGRAPAGANAAVTSLKDQSRAGLCRRRRRQGRRGGVRAPLGRGRRADPVGLRLGRRQGRFGQDRRRQVARPGARRNRRQAHRRQAQGRRSRTWSTRSRTRSTTAAISPRPRRRRSCR